MTVADLRKSRGLLIDTNLLVLLIVGALGPEQIGKHKLTSKYIEEDYRLLLSFAKQFEHITTTPTILTEASNLLEGYAYKGQEALVLLQRIVEVAEELAFGSISTMTAYSKSYIKFGLSDATIHRVAQENYLVLTDDLRLCAYLQGLGLLAINFNNLRTGYLLH
jgi:hypothetical protein